MLDNLSRILLTRNKTRQGVLPPPIHHHAAEDVGDGRLCDGCGEPISAGAKLSVVTRATWLPLWFHHDCYQAWVTARAKSVSATP
jgi:hypothetical protein